jgi:hypothetical protein
MEDTAMINLWKSYDRKLEEVLLFSRQHAEELTRIKVRSFLTSMTPIKIFTIITGILWAGFIDVLLVGTFAIASPFFLVSLGIQVTLTKLAIGVYLYQLILIHRVDISEPILATQEKIARLQSSTIWVTRLLFLQLPIWTTFYLSKGMFQYGNTSLIILQVFITLLFTFMAVWLFLNIKYENRDKKWFRLIFKGKEWDPMIKSMELLGQIHEYRK